MQVVKSETEILYDCTLPEFLTTVEEFFDSYQSEYPVDSKGKLICYSALATEIYLLRKHRLKLLETRDTDEDWIDTTGKLCSKVSKKLGSKEIKLARYKKEMPLGS